MRLRRPPCPPGAVRFGLLARAMLGAALAVLRRELAGATHVGCRHLGNWCQRGRQCCSGRCRGPKGKKRCRGHHAGTCLLGQATCLQPGPVNCNGRSDCLCYMTTGGASFCGTGGDSVDCRRDADCVDLGWPRGSACVGCLNVAACIGPCRA